MSIYRLSRSCLMSEIKLFHDTLSLPVGPGNIGEGSCEENPIRLEGIAKATFDFIIEHLFGK